MEVQKSIEEKRVRDCLPVLAPRRSSGQKKPSDRCGEYSIKGMNPRLIDNRLHDLAEVMRSGVLNNVDSEAAQESIEEKRVRDNSPVPAPRRSSGQKKPPDRYDEYIIKESVEEQTEQHEVEDQFEDKIVQSTEIHAQKEQFDEELLESIVNQENNGEECDKESMEEKRVRDDLPSPVQRRKKPSDKDIDELSSSLTENGDHDTLDRINFMRSSLLLKTALPIAHLPPREIFKEGFLSKQGGENQEEGWTRRYMRFDGQTLRYYMNEKTTESLRIIPVAIMLQAYYEERKTSPGILTSFFSLRKFEFSLRTRNRTYLFRTENHDNLVQWICFLTEAILKTSKIPYSDVIGGSMCNPDYEGSFQFWKNNKKYHAALKGDIFRYYYNKEDYEIDCPVHELSMRVSNVEKLDDTKLHLRSEPHQQFVLQFESEMEADQWNMFFTEAITTTGNYEIISHIKENKDNRTCADCSTEKTNWASINLGIVLCIKCAGIHRGLGESYSKVRSLRMDGIFRENDALLRLFSAIGNVNANRFWYANPPADRMLDSQTPDNIRQKHIHQKYVTKDFVEKSLMESTNLNKDFIEAVRKGDVFQTMMLYESGADINYTDEEGSLDAIGIALAECHGVLLEYLEQNKNRMREPTEKEDPSHKRTSIYHDGYLEKTGPNMRGYHKRWFVLQYGRLTYFNDKKSTRDQIEKGSIDLTQIVCVAVTDCNERPFCFDLTCKTPKGLQMFRFAAKDGDGRRMWINMILQVRSPETIVDSVIQLKQYKIAGNFYVQQHSQGPWTKSWLGVGIQCIDIHYTNEAAQAESIPIDTGTLKIYKCNASKSSKMLLDAQSAKQLDENKIVQLQFSQRVIRIQGYNPEDTDKLFGILHQILLY